MSLDSERILQKLIIATRYTRQKKRPDAGTPGQTQKSSMCRENMYEMDKEVKGDRHEH